MNTLYVTDLDGTLLGEDGYLTESTKEKLIDLLSKGIPLTYATARSFTSAHQRLKDVPFTLPALTYNGCFLVEGGSGNVIRMESFEEIVLANVKETFDRYNICPLTYSILDGRECNSCYTKESSLQQNIYMDSKPNDKRNRFVNSKDALYEGKIFYFTLINTYEALKPIYESLLQYDSEYRNKTGQASFRITFQEEIYKPGEYWLELMPNTAGKAKGIERLKKMTGAKKIVCFGDASNDIEMFQAADEAYAVANACNELKNIANGVIGSNKEEGVLCYILDKRIMKNLTK